MTARNKNKAQGIIIIIILLIIGFFVLFMLISAFSAKRASPIVKEANWQVDEHTITQATRGEQVEAHVTIKATEEYVGSIVVKIKKDISWRLDTDYHVETFPVSLTADQETEIKVTFTPDETSIGRLRGYFIEVSFQVTGGSWAMENSYPPRLRVID
jgi:hypothetical protein